MSLSGETEMGEVLEYENMWRHWCTTEKAILYVERGSQCNWCGADESYEEEYKGLHWAFPLCEYLRWPEYMEYYYLLDKKSS